MASWVAEAEGRACSAPALEKGLDILATLCRSEQPLSQKKIAQRLGRSVGGIYRMVACLVNRDYVTLVDENTEVVRFRIAPTYFQAASFRLWLRE